MPETFTLQRTGARPLQFRGDVLAAADSRALARDPRDVNRWHELAVYRTEGGRFVLAIEFHSRYGEGPIFTAETFDSLIGVAERLAGWNPVPAGVGFPAGDHYRDKQAKLEARLDFEFRAAATSLWAGIHGADAVELID